MCVLRTQVMRRFGLCAAMLIWAFVAICPAACAYDAAADEAVVQMDCHGNAESPKDPAQHDSRDESCCDSHTQAMTRDGQTAPLSIDHVVLVALASDILPTVSAHTHTDHNIDPPPIAAAPPLYLHQQVFRI